MNSWGLFVNIARAQLECQLIATTDFSKVTSVCGAYIGIRLDRTAIMQMDALIIPLIIMEVVIMFFPTMIRFVAGLFA